MSTTKELLEAIETIKTWIPKRTGLHATLDEIAEIIKRDGEAPVAHGWWIKEKSNGYEEYVMCSACGGSFTIEDAEGWTYIQPPYCQHCGAKMDLEGKPDGGEEK